MATSKMNKEFQEKIKKGYKENEEAEIAQKRRESLTKHICKRRNGEDRDR